MDLILNIPDRDAHDGHQSAMALFFQRTFVIGNLKAGERKAVELSYFYVSASQIVFPKVILTDTRNGKEYSFLLPSFVSKSKK